MWIIFVLQAQNKEAEKLNLDEFIHDSLKSKTEVKAATYSGLFIKKQGRKFIGQVVVDV